MDAAAQTPGFLSFRPFGFAEAKRTRWKKGAFSFISWSTAFQEKFSTPSLVADLSIEDLALEQRFFTFLPNVRANTFLDGFSEVGAVHHCVRQSFKIAASCQPFSKPMQFFWQISGFPPRFVRNSGLKKTQRLVYIYCLKP